GLAGGSRVWQLNAARVLCQTRGKAAMKAVLHLLTAGTDDSNRAICDLLTPALREMDAREQNSFYDEVEAFAAKLDAKEQRPAAGCSSSSARSIIRRCARTRWSRCCAACATRTCARTNTPSCSPCSRK